jgi:PAS domain S-box-containing protein
LSGVRKGVSEKKKKRKNAQDELQKENSILQEMLNETENMHLVFLDKDFNFVRVNEAYAKTCGYTPEEMIGKNHFALYPHDENEAIFKRVRDTGMQTEFHNKPFVFPDQPKRGVTYWDWMLKPVKNEVGEVEGLVFSLIETTKRKKAEEKIQNLAKFPSENPNPVLRIGKNGYFLYCNDAAKHFLKASRCDIGEVIPEVWHKFVNAAFASGKRQEFEEQIGGRTFVFAVSPLADYVNIYGLDITERKKTEEALRQSRTKLELYSKNLEHLVGERTKQLQEKERLAAIGATAGMVGHDIRNPLQAIVGDLYLAKSDLVAVPDGEAKEGLKESLEEIEKNVGYIDKIVQDLQDFAKSINPYCKKTDVEEICQEVLFINIIPENIDIFCEIEKKAKIMITDPDLLKRILSNLVNNAVQAMSDGGKLEIRALREKSEITIFVQDTGVGIPDEVKPKLFTPLFSTKSKGQGFGLAVVKRMTEALGGTVSFESEVGKGTKFIVRLPT